MKIILASSSPYRRELLARLGIPFETVSPEVDESPLPGEAPPALAERLAVAKARKVAAGRANTLVIGADQVAVYGGTIFGKPGGREAAAAQLRAASGRTVVLYTGLALVNSDTGRVQSEVLPYRVTFRPLDETLIQRYLDKEQPYGCAGSLRSEGLGIVLLEKFDGDDPNALIGLPLIRLVRMLEHEGVDLLSPAVLPRGEDT